MVIVLSGQTELEMSVPVAKGVGSGCGAHIGFNADEDIDGHRDRSLVDGFS